MCYHWLLVLSEMPDQVICIEDSFEDVAKALAEYEARELVHFVREHKDTNLVSMCIRERFARHKMLHT